MPPASRVSDTHACPMATPMPPPAPPLPHVGLPIFGPGCLTVLVGKMPQVRMGDVALCTLPPPTPVGPDPIAVGSTSVMVGKKPAARMGDATAHGGALTSGFPTVMIGG
jgi:uncharacterized Zn-binding protein involved in type VI secretion